MSYGPRKRRKSKKHVVEQDLNSFAFLIHPLSIEDVTKKYKIAEKVPPKLLANVFSKRRPFVVSEITGIKSLTGTKAFGWFVVVPLLTWQFAEMEEDYVIEKIAKACKVSKKLGAKIVGLGAFTAIPGGGGRLLANQVDVPITTGNTYTTTVAIEGTKKAAQVMGRDLRNVSLAVVGATGSIGRACSTILAKEVGQLNLVGRDIERLNETSDSIKQETGGDVLVSTNMSEAISKADIIITVTGSADSIIYPDDLKPGAIICDVARPRDVSDLVSRVRDDVLVIDGGIVKVPGNNVNFGIDFGPPKGMAEGCIAETILLALEGRYENYTIGKNITSEMVLEMKGLAEKHGFELAGLRRLEKLISESEIEQIKINAGLLRKVSVFPISLKENQKTNIK